MESTNGRSSEKKRDLWVCWLDPGPRLDSAATILTFLPPAVEHRLKCGHRGKVFLGREESLSVRKHAREVYFRLTEEMASVPVLDGKTLRQAFSRNGKSSRWWYHPVSFRDCETDPTFDRIIAIFTILKIARELQPRQIVLVGAPAEVADTLRHEFQIKVVNPPSSRRNWPLLRAFSSRIVYGIRILYVMWLIPEKWRLRNSSMDVVFLGFWNWTFRTNPSDGTRQDMYYGGLPDMFADRKQTVGWFAWVERSVNQPKQRLIDLVRSARDQTDVLLLQSQLTFGDVIQALLDYRPLLSIIILLRSPQFRRVFLVESVDFLPLFIQPLLAGCVDYMLPHYELVETAVARACDQVRPNLTFSFLEHFPHARAHYAGVASSRISAINCAVQHASYCSEKTFLFFEPRTAFDGQPDGCHIPRPDYVFAMGTLGAELFRECGYSENQVITTGSPRYDHFRAEGEFLQSPTKSATIRLLLVGGLAEPADLDLIDAAAEVTSENTHLSVVFRKHPFSKIDESPSFTPYRSRILLSKGCSLEEDLDNADLILFTYSTVAEEAFVKGRVVWHWRPIGFNGSALVEVTSIPSFTSVGALNEALRAFCSDRGACIPGRETRAIVIERLFHRLDGKAAQRIASFCRGTIQCQRSL